MRLDIPVALEDKFSVQKEMMKYWAILLYDILWGRPRIAAVALKVMNHENFMF